MNATNDLDRVLEDWFRAEAPASAPSDMVDAIAGATATTRRRPGWLVADRWLPRPSRSTRALGIAAVVAFALLAVVTALVGVGMRPRVPPPFGPARSGMFALGLEGAGIVEVDLDGSRHALAGTLPSDANPVFSLDGTRLAAWTATPRGGFELVVMAADGSGRTVAAHVPDAQSGDGPRVAWSPDGQSIAYSTAPEGRSTIHVARRDGSGDAVVGDPTISAADPAWSPDGQLLAFRGTAGGGSGLFVMHVDGSEPRRLVATAVDGTTAVSWSPDGRQLGFATCDASCRIHVTDAATASDRVIDEANVVVGPAWSPDGRQLAWLRCPTPAPDPCEYVVADRDGTHRASYPHPDAPHQGLFYDPLGSVVGWSPDGTRLTGILAAPDDLSADRLIVFDLAGRPPAVIDAPGLRAWDQQRLAP